MSQHQKKPKKTLSGGARKRKGSRRELQAKALLEKQGYLVTKAAGSLGAFDLIAVGEVDVRLVQAKANRMPSRMEMETLRKLAKRLPWSVEIWVYKDRQGWEIVIL